MQCHRGMEWLISLTRTPYRFCNLPHNNLIGVPSRCSLSRGKADTSCWVSDRISDKFVKIAIWHESPAKGPEKCHGEPRPVARVTREGWTEMERDLRGFAAAAVLLTAMAAAEAAFA